MKFTRSYILSVFLAASLFFSCTGTGNKGSEGTNTDINNEEEMSGTTGNKAEGEESSFFSDGDLAFMKKYFSDSTITGLSNCMAGLLKAGSDKELADLFKNMLKLKASMVKDIYVRESNEGPRDGYEIMEEIRPLDSAFTGFRATCVAECTEFDYTFFLPDLLKIAKRTEGDADDVFFNLVIMASGEYGGEEYGWLRFFNRTWDYGGGSVLGDSLCYDFLEQSWNALQKSKLFEAQLLNLRKRCIQDMKHNIYMQPKEAVMAELERILKGGIISAEEDKELQELRKRNNSKTETLQFDCNQGDCDYGG